MSSDFTTDLRSYTKIIIIKRKHNNYKITSSENQKLIINTVFFLSLHVCISVEYEHNILCAYNILIYT